jgi:hypothetical protein
MEGSGGEAAARFQNLDEVKHLAFELYLIYHNEIDQKGCSI